MILSVCVPDFAEWYSEHAYPLAINTIGCVSGMIPFLYMPCCGINYYRRSFSEEERKGTVSLDMSGMNFEVEA